MLSPLWICSRNRININLGYERRLLVADKMGPDLNGPPMDAIWNGLAVFKDVLNQYLGHVD